MEITKAKRTDMFLVPIGQIEVEEGFNPREDYGDIEELAQSIKQNGVRQPLKGFKKRGMEIYVLTDGHRRLKAAQLAIKKGAEIAALPFLIETQSEDRRTLDLLLMNEGKPLTMLEEAEVYRRLKSYGWSEKQIAKESGKTQTAISNCLLLLTASPALKDKIKQGLVSATTVLEKLRKKDSVQVMEEVDEALRDNNGKKVSNKHLKKDMKEIKLPTKELNRLRHTLTDSFKNLSKDKLEILDALHDYSTGDITLSKLADYFV